MVDYRRNDGRDYNHYQKVQVSRTEFGQPEDGYQSDVFILRGAGTVMLLNENTSGVVEYSFNGFDVHGELDPALPTRGMTFDNRSISRIWFRVQSGSTGPIKVRVDAW